MAPATKQEHAKKGCSASAERHLTFSDDAKIIGKSDCMTGITLLDLNALNFEELSSERSQHGRDMNQQVETWSKKISTHIERNAIDLGTALSQAAKKNQVIIIGSFPSRSFAPFHESLATYVTQLKAAGVTSLVLPIFGTANEKGSNQISSLAQLKEALDNNQAWYRESFEGLEKVASAALANGIKIYPVASEPPSLALKGTQRLGNALWGMIGSVTPINFRLPPVDDLKIDPELLNNALSSATARRGKVLAILPEKFSELNKPTRDDNDKSKLSYPGDDAIQNLAKDKGVVRFRAVHSFGTVSSMLNVIEPRWIDLQDTTKKNTGNIVLPDFQLKSLPEKVGSDYVIFLPRYSTWWSK